MAWQSSELRMKESLNCDNENEKGARGLVNEKEREEVSDRRRTFTSGCSEWLRSSQFLWSLVWEYHPNFNVDKIGT